MAIDPYQDNVEQYDRWFDKNCQIYAAELKAVKSLLPEKKQRGVEIGAGTGRFAAPLGLEIGIEPSEKMGSFAQKRGIQIIRGIAEELPLQNACADLVLMVTVICFLNNIEAAFSESFRALSKGGYIVVGMLERGSPLGKIYVEKKNDSVFYRNATFYSADEVVALMQKSGFSDFRFKQTVFQNMSAMPEHEIVRDGCGDGLFTVISGRKK